MDERKDEAKDDDSKDGRPVTATRIAENSVVLRHDIPSSPKKKKKKVSHLYLRGHHLGLIHVIHDVM
jgi:hypothetical protein